MKITNAIFESKQYFTTIGKIHNSDQLSVMDAYRINRLVKKLNELNTEYDELKKKILAQYGTPGEKEGSFTVEPENTAAFSTEYNDLISHRTRFGNRDAYVSEQNRRWFLCTDLNIMEMFFDLSGLEIEEKTEDEPESSTEEST